MTVVNILECCSVQLMDGSFICWQWLDIINVVGVETGEDFSVQFCVYVLFIFCVCSFSDNFERVDWKRPFVDDIRSRSLNIGLILSCIDHVTTELPCCNFSKILAIGVVYWFFRIGQLINVIPEWILTFRYGMPISINTFTILFP